MSLPEGRPTGYSARGTGGVFLEEESAAADADFSVSPRQSRGVLHTNNLVNKKDAPAVMAKGGFRTRYG
ncbi:MAG: hypothetical protein A3H76_06305 [Candidatus Lloydbacteria bacterium RIFCSPLOWO2_02_FULL_54_12]|nr:MAG: hypothetical protein A3H76_06305 [Candidatus Lloydbacteria bacterium RIFCSPLOWO2_02_FULL_54_12]